MFSFDPPENIGRKGLTNHELFIRLEKTQKAKQLALKQVARLSAAISRIMREEGVCASSEHNEIFRSVLNKEDPKLEEVTPMWLLWQQQIKQTSNPKAMRGHPLIIRWCLSIFHVSPAVYKQIASKCNKVLALPHINTLEKYINYTTPKSGFNPDVIKKFDINSHKLESFQNNVSRNEITARASVQKIIRKIGLIL